VDLNSKDNDTLDNANLEDQLDQLMSAPLVLPMEGTKTPKTPPPWATSAPAVVRQLTQTGFLPRTSGPWATLKTHMNGKTPCQKS
jgi:hypothetical protein